MDLNLEYAAHQQALMRADTTPCPDLREAHLRRADGIAARITLFQHQLGAAAACAWSTLNLAAPALITAPARA